MTREELREHCKKQVESCEMWARHNGEEPSEKVYEEHKLILELLDQEPEHLVKESGDLVKDLVKDTISRQAVDELSKELVHTTRDKADFLCNFWERLQKLPPVTPTQRWIPCSERLPEELEPVNITWVNHNPESYYAKIKDKPFTATGVYFNGQWYWWSTLCTDILAEYSHNYDDIINDDIEITAWMPLPEPYKAEREVK